MKISDINAAHFVTYALGVTCDHEHIGAFERCTILVTLFGISFASFINYIFLNQLNYDRLQPETNIMINSASRLNIMLNTTYFIGCESWHSSMLLARSGMIG